MSSDWKGQPNKRSVDERGSPGRSAGGSGASGMRPKAIQPAKGDDALGTREALRQSPPRILYVSDDAPRARAFEQQFRARNFAVTTSTSAEHTLELAAIRAFDVFMVRLDLEIGHTGGAAQGLELCRRLLAMNPNFAVAINGPCDPAAADATFEVGAKGYLPMDMPLDSIAKRLRALAPVHEPNMLRVGGLALNDHNRKVTFDGMPVPLKRTARAVLAQLMRHPGRVHSLEELHRAVKVSGTVRTMESYIRQLRIALKAVGAENLLRNERGDGYMIAALA